MNKKSRVSTRNPSLSSDDDSFKTKSSSLAQPPNASLHSTTTTTTCSTTDEKCLEKFKPEESIQYECHHHVIEQPEHNRNTTATATKIENLTKTLTRQKSNIVVNFSLALLIVILQDLQVLNLLIQQCSKMLVEKKLCGFRNLSRAFQS